MLDELDDLFDRSCLDFDRWYRSNDGEFLGFLEWQAEHWGLAFLRHGTRLWELVGKPHPDIDRPLPPQVALQNLVRLILLCAHAASLQLPDEYALLDLPKAIPDRSSGDWAIDFLKLLYQISTDLKQLAPTGDFADPACRAELHYNLTLLLGSVLQFAEQRRLSIEPPE